MTDDYTRLVIRDMRVMMGIGVYASELGVLQPVLINLTADVDAPAAQNDVIEDVVCYATLAQAIRDIAQAGHVGLVETLAQRIADAALGMKGTHAVTVRVEKPDAQPDCAGVGVEIRRTR